MSLVNFYRILYCFLLVALFQSNKLFAQSQEQLVKAAFIEKFTQHIKWPDNAISQAQPELFTILVVGNEEFCQTLNKVYANRKLQDKEVIVKCYNNFNIKNHADIIYISGEGVSELENVLHQCHETPCLIISESKGLAQKGAHINFYFTNEETLHFEINKKSIDASGLKPDFLLLDFAKIVDNQ